MGYYETGLLSRDMNFLLRVAACYATETRSPDPETWANMHMWQIAAAPGFGDAYSYAFNSEPPNPAPGKDPAVITDGQILAAVQYIMNEENPPT